MDIHAPRHPVRSVREFLFEMFTVTCGVLIALALEQAVEWHRTASLVAHARADFRQEISENREKIKPALAAESSLESALTTLIAWGEARQAHKPPLPLPSLALLTTRDFVNPLANAREAAIATQAIAHMPFAEARALLTAYGVQQSLINLNALAIPQWVSVGGFGDPTALADADIPAGLAAMRIAYAYAHSIAAAESRLLEAYDSAEKALAEN